MLRIIASGACLIAVFALAQAHEYRQGNLEIDHPWARPTAEGAKNGAAYLTLKNSGKEEDKLVSVQTPAAEKAEVHEHVHEGDIMKMRPLTGGVPVPPGETVAFKPGGYHIMLMGLKQKLEDGKNIPLKLTFAKAGDVDVEVKVEKNPSPGQATGGMHMH